MVAFDVIIATRRVWESGIKDNNLSIGSDFVNLISRDNKVFM